MGIPNQPETGGTLPETQTELYYVLIGYRIYLSENLEPDGILPEPDPNIRIHGPIPT